MKTDTSNESENENEQAASSGLDYPPCSLFVGGASDGKWMRIPDHLSTVHIPSTDGGYEAYRVEWFGSAENHQKVCVFSDLSSADAMGLLVSNYKANVQIQQPATREDDEN